MERATGIGLLLLGAALLAGALTSSLLDALLPGIGGVLAVLGGVARL